MGGPPQAWIASAPPMEITSARVISFVRCRFLLILSAFSTAGFRLFATSLGKKRVKKGRARVSEGRRPTARARGRERERESEDSEGERERETRTDRQREAPRTRTREILHKKRWGI